MLYDIYELLKKDNKGDVINTLQDMKDLKEESLKWDEYFWDFVNKKTIEQGVCPCCGVELESKFIGRERYEMWGKEVTEDIKVMICPKCGNIYE